MFVKNTKEFGKIEIKTVNMPTEVIVKSATYLFSGSILVVYKTKEDVDTKDYYNIGVCSSEGTNFKKIFSGKIKEPEKANGIRYMPYYDNTKVLLGDYVLECSPSVDDCKESKLIPVKYPNELVEDSKVLKHWSEIIIAPDNVHMAWTSLRTDVGAANFIGKLIRKENEYVIEDIKIISTLNQFREDPKKEGYIIPNKMYGGELKQFIKGGKAISLVGGPKGGTADSIIEDLETGEVTQITKTPSYDETTMFSPDEKLGVVMSSRGSESTNTSIFGLLPRPPFGTNGLIGPLYMYSVSAVRQSGTGNVGPVLIDIEKSKNEEGYMGIQLNDPEGSWVYYSPISWNPDNKSAIWMEGKRGKEEFRIRKVDLCDYKPKEPVALRKTPEEIPYAKDYKGYLEIDKDAPRNGKIEGKHSGYILLKSSVKNSLESTTEVEYVNYSDDGKTFLDGFEKTQGAIFTKTVYETDLKLTGDKEGEMKLRAVFKGKANYAGAELIFDKAEDGKPQSYGYAKYENTKIDIEDMKKH